MSLKVYQVYRNSNTNEILFNYNDAKLNLLDPLVIC